ncbi:MAG TPA: hypothetical protein VGR27_03730, partial [Longimicrobiaceae bacterium]|nr:hypothetical protein [Longimicrobiaceae bacterium]
MPRREGRTTCASCQSPGGGSRSLRTNINATPDLLNGAAAHARYRDGITPGTLEELVSAFAQKLNAPEIDPKPQRPGGYEETGFVTRDIPGVG